MSLKASREALLAALEAGGVRTYYGVGVFQPPCARIFPADPWVGASGQLDSKRLQRWEIWAVAGKADSSSNFDELEALVQSIHDATIPMQAWSEPRWNRPTSTDMGGTRYLACRGVVETLAEV